MTFSPIWSEPSKSQPIRTLIAGGVSPSRDACCGPRRSRDLRHSKQRQARLLDGAWLTHGRRVPHEELGGQTGLGPPMEKACCSSQIRWAAITGKELQGVP